MSQAHRKINNLDVEGKIDRDLILIQSVVTTSAILNLMLQMGNVAGIDVGEFLGRGRQSPNFNLFLVM